MTIMPQPSSSVTTTSPLTPSTPSIHTTSSTEPTALTALRAALAANESELANMNNDIAETKRLIKELDAKVEGRLKALAAAGDTSERVQEALAKEHGVAVERLSEANKHLARLHSRQDELSRVGTRRWDDIIKYHIENDARQTTRDEARGTQHLELRYPKLGSNHSGGLHWQ
ncbi:hypothetical protein HDU96_010624 [Phlyctochytrium bullatum]|nr:hypothetical protein HDU96_010624 [Phlyctochytrium bullatum]